MRRPPFLAPMFVVDLPLTTFAASDRPHVLMIMSDNAGITALGAYHRGMAGYQTPNIDRIANEGVLFIHHEAE